MNRCHGSVTAVGFLLHQTAGHPHGMWGLAVLLESLMNDPVTKLGEQIIADCSRSPVSNQPKTLKYEVRFP